MVDDLVREENPAFFRNDLHQILFDFDWIIVFSEIETTGYSVHVCINNNAGSNSVCRSKYDICGLSGGSRHGQTALQ